MGGKSFKLGDVIGVQIAPDVLVPAKIVYESTYYKNVIGLRFQEAIRGVNGDTEIDKIPFDGPVIYTSGLVVQRQWEIIGYQALVRGDVEATRRIVAGRVVQEDADLGDATEEDYRRLPQMTVAGVVALIKRLQRSV